MSTAHDLLFEIGVEELPSSFVAAALSALPDLAKKQFAELRLTHGPVVALGTPRRLALIVEGLAAEQPELVEELVGPPVKAAYDKEGKRTRAAEAFANKVGCKLEELRTVETPKGTYLAGTKREAGKRTIELLGAALVEIASKIPFRKSMRWSDLDTSFGRPIKWLVALYGDEVVDLEYAGIKSGRISQGHRFLSKGPVEIPNARAYVDKLRAAHVIVSPKEREELLRKRLHEAAEQLGGTLIGDDFLMSENLSLVEEPHVIIGGFDRAFLKLPEEVILEVARGHQRYFGVRGPSGELLPNYLAVVNTAENVENIRRGNDRVMRARLADAKFFFEEDLRIPLATRREKLAGIVFQNRLGHMLAKVERIEKLTADLGKRLHLPAKSVEVAIDGARLAKCDLVSLMVGEFPELQGVMGRTYALAQGEPQDVADVIRDHYAPKGASDATAPSDASALVAIADRLDTLVGCFGVGLAPTGTADPFALRRAALGVLRTLLDRGWNLSLTDAVGLAYARLEGVKLDLSLEDLQKKLGDFFRDRLRGLLVAELPTDVVDACLAASFDDPVDVRARARALAELPADVRARAGEVFKRATNIAKDAPAGDPKAPKEIEAHPHASEIALFDAFVSLVSELRKASASSAWPQAFAAIAAFAPALHKFFEDVFVMVEDQAIRENRLRLMRAISEQCSKIAHFQLLSGKQG